MRQTIRCIFAIACLVLTSTAARADIDRASQQQFDQLAGRFLQRLPEEYPVRATSLGDHSQDGALDAVDERSWLARAASANDLLSDLVTIDMAKLDAARRIDAEMLRNELQLEAWQHGELREWQWNPLIYTEIAGQSLYGLLAREYAPATQRLESAAARLEALPVFFEQMRSAVSVQQVPAIHAQTAAAQHAGLNAMVDSMLVPQLSGLDAPLRDRLTAAIAEFRVAATAHQRWLDETLTSAAAGEFRLGLVAYEKKLKHTLHTTTSRASLRARAEDEYQRVRESMYTLAQTIYAEHYPMTFFPDQPGHAYKQAIVRFALELAYSERPTPEQILPLAEQALGDAIAFVETEDLVSIPDQPLKIIEMPEFQRGVAFAYCDAPGALDKELPTFYAVSPIPTGWSEQQTESFLREYNTRSVHELTLHEAVPGHFLQLAHANRYNSDLRGILSSQPFIEGWAVYGEEMMINAGYYDNDPLMKLIQLKWYLRVVINAILDQAVHVDGISKKEAMQLMVEGGFQEESEANEKWTRAQLTAGQLSTYFFGYQELVALRRDAENAEEFDLKTYHDKLLSFGSPPVHLLRELILEP